MARTQSTSTFSYTTTAVALRCEIWEEPTHTGQSVPLEIFSHKTSPMQALTRHLVDEKGLRFAHVARMLGKSPKSVWASYHQTGKQPTPSTTSLSIPVDIFANRGAPLEALVTYLLQQGMRNVQIARALGRSPKTTHTVAKRSEVRT